MSRGVSHRYEVTVTWTGDLGEGTSSYRTYGRDHEIAAPGRPAIAGSSDPAFRGDPDRWDPERLLVVSLSQCHMLGYLHLCSGAGVVVRAYEDRATGTMAQSAGGGGRFTDVLLCPTVSVAEPSMVPRARALHEPAHQLCFIANSVNFPVRHEPSIAVAS